jgi:hypothetical protein
VQIYEKDEIKLALSSVLDNMIVVSKQNSTLIFNNENINLIPNLQSTYSLKLNSPLERTIHGILLTYMLKSEVVGPGSCLETLEHIKKGLLDFFEDNQQRNLKNILNQISSEGACIPKYDDFLNICLSKIDNQHSYLKNMLIDAINHSGFAGKISVEKCSVDDHLEIVDGYNFYVSSSINKPCKIKDCLVLCVDGLIESISEIHHILQYCNETKNSLLIVARGFSDDVLNTFSVNRKRGTLNVYDAKVIYDLESVNVLVDIAITSGCDVVSSLKGELISSIKPHTLTHTKEIILSNTKLIIKNSKSKSATNNQINELRKKRSIVNDDVQKIIDKRIRSLIPSHVVIRLKDDIEYVKKSQSVDYALRLFKNMNDYGIYENEKMQRQLFSTVFASKYYAMKFLKSFKDIGTFLIEDHSL